MVTTRGARKRGDSPLPTAPILGRPAGESNGRQCPFDLGREVHEDELAAMVEVVFAALVNHAEQVVPRRLFIRKNLVDLPHDQGCFVVGIVNTHGELSLSRIHVHSSRNDLSRFDLADDVKPHANNLPGT